MLSCIHDSLGVRERTSYLIKKIFSKVKRIILWLGDKKILQVRILRKAEIHTGPHASLAIFRLQPERRDQGV